MIEQSKIIYNMESNLRFKLNKYISPVFQALALEKKKELLLRIPSFGISYNNFGLMTKSLRCILLLDLKLKSGKV